MALLEVDKISVQFDGISALTDLSFEVEEGQIYGLIGPNGAGKTTLFNVVSRVYDPTYGSIHFDGKDLTSLHPHQVSDHGIYRTFQNLALWPRMGVIENVMAGAHNQAKQNFLTAALNFGRKKEEAQLRDKALAILADLDLLDVAFQACAGLPYGTMKRIELARALIGDPKMLMLDEPATGLTQSEVADLVDLIRGIRDRYKLTILVVEHHMGLVMSLCERIVVLDFGRKIAEGTPSQIQQNPAVIAAYLGASH